MINYRVFYSQDNEGGSVEEEHEPPKNFINIVRVEHKELSEEVKKIVIGRNTFGDDGWIYDSLGRPIRRYR